MTEHSRRKAIQTYSFFIRLFLLRVCNDDDVDSINDIDDIDDNDRNYSNSCRNCMNILGEKVERLVMILFRNWVNEASGEDSNSMLAFS